MADRHLELRLRVTAALKGSIRHNHAIPKKEILVKRRCPDDSAINSSILSPRRFASPAGLRGDCPAGYAPGCADVRRT
jgi:hypothetical protein